MPLIDREHSGNILLLGSKYNGNVLLIDRASNGDVLLIEREHPHIGRWCLMCISSKAHKIGKTPKAHIIGEKTF